MVRAIPYAARLQRTLAVVTGDCPRVFVKNSSIAFHCVRGASFQKIDHLGLHRILSGAQRSQHYELETFRASRKSTKSAPKRRRNVSCILYSAARAILNPRKIAQSFRSLPPVCRREERMVVTMLSLCRHFRGCRRQGRIRSAQRLGWQYLLSRI